MFFHESIEFWVLDLALIFSSWLFFIFFEIFFQLLVVDNHGYGLH